MGKHCPANMDPALIWIYVLLTFSVCICAITGNPIGTTNIDCSIGTDEFLGEVDEGYTGDIELVNGIAAGSSVKLVPHVFLEHIKFLELSFTVGDTSATVRTKKELDADVLASSGTTLYYSVMCDGIGKLNNTRTLKINDLNDNGPIFKEKLYRKTVSETLTVDTEVLKVQAVDGDSTSANNRVSYSIVTPSSEDFIVNNAGGFILKRRLNYNAMKNYNFTVEAQDSGGLSDRATVLIDVEDFDNLNPYFNHNLYQASIPENQMGSFSTIQPEVIKAQDGDIGINMTVVYSIRSVSPSEYQSNFDINPSSGVMSVTSAVDREELGGTMIIISIKATQSDDSLKTADAFVSVTIEDVNDNSPEFDKPNYSETILENSLVDTVLLRTTLSDPDEGGFVGNLRILPESAPFSVSPDGTLRVKNSTALDREATGSFMFQIEARETNPPNHVVVANVSVTLLDENDNSPTFSSSKYEGKVFKNQTEGMLLVQVNAEDPDAGQNGRIRYSIDFGNKDGYFSIDGNTGKVTLNKTIPLQDNKILEFSLQITARDGGVVSRSSSVQVDIFAPGDSKPQFLQSTYRGTIEEEQDPGVVILRASFLSAAPEVPVTLQIVTDADKFTINPDGVFTSKAKLDYDEAPHNYSVTISISDGVTTDNAVVEVQVTDVNDNSPVFTPSSVTKSVPEDAEMGSNVTAVLARDKDSGFNGEIRYSLQGGEGKFSIDPKSGMVSVAAALDRETKAEFSLVVVAQDQGRPSRSTTSTVVVRVSDINDNVPMFSKAEYEVEVSETESVGTTVLTLSAVDPDEGVNGRVAYSIVQQNPLSTAPVFELDSSTGALRLTQTLDYNVAKVYSLMVQAADGGTPSLVGNGTVVVRVMDVNNNPPQFSKDSYNVSVSENLASGASILTLEVTDRDEGGFSKGHFLYTSDTFDITKQGMVFLKMNATLDRETTDSYILQVVAVDQPTDGLRATAQLNITVLDYNDNSPQFPMLPDYLRVLEGDYSDKTPGEVYQILATDADLGPNGEVTLSFPSPNPAFRFREDGMLLAVGVLDRESKDSYELVVVASDKGTPQRENITIITVTVTDVNDNRPVFSASTYTKTILVKGAKEGDLLLTLSATDKDTGNNSLITYSFSAGSSPYLAVNSETGAVTLASDLADVMEDTKLELTAIAKDQGQPPLNSTATVIINLRILSLVEGVAFESSSYNFSLLENQPGEVTVGVVVATSGSVTYNVTYTLTTHTDTFSINTNGVIKAMKMMDKETQEWYILEVEAVDTRVPPTSAIALVKVQVEDVNEAPQFVNNIYKATIFSIAPYRSPVIYVKATDPDIGQQAELVYSLTAASEYFDIDSSTGLVYVVSAERLSGQLTTMEVKARDPKGLYATTNVEVEVHGNASSSDVVVISLNQAANVVEKKVPEMEKSLGKALGWTVRVTGLSSNDRVDSKSRSSREGPRTWVSFIAMDGGEVISSQEVIEKLQSEADTVRTELVKVFGEGLQHNVEEEANLPASNQATVIALGVMLGLSILALVLMVALSIIKFRRMKKHQGDPDRQSFDMGRHGLENTGKTIPEFSELGQTYLRRTGDQKTRDRETVESNSGNGTTIRDIDSGRGSNSGREDGGSRKTERDSVSKTAERDNDGYESYNCAL